jgi:hypothetical protein
LDLVEAMDLSSIIDTEVAWQEASHG